MNILIVSHLYPTPDDTAYGIFVHEQAQTLAERGHEIRVISPTQYVPNVPYLPDRWARFSDTPNRATIDNIEIQYLKYLSLPSHRTLPLVAKSVRRTVTKAISNLESSGFIPDVINAHVPLPDGYACIPSSHQLNIPLVTTVHGSNIYKSSKNPICRRQIKSVFETSTEVVFNTSILKSEAKSYFPNVHSAPIVHNGIPLDQVESAPWADLSGIFPEDRTVVSSLGYLIERKNHSDVLAAITEIEPSKRPYYLIIGEGPNRETLEHQVENSGLSEYVHFTGYVDKHTDVLAKLKATDIMALPSTREDFGIAYIEAMACGSPVIGCKGEGPSDFVKDGETGYLVPPNDPTAIAEILQELSEDKNKRDQMGDAAREYVLENLTWEENARRNEEIYQRAIGQL